MELGFHGWMIPAVMALFVRTFYKFILRIFFGLIIVPRTKSVW